MKVHTYPLGPIQTNCYIIENDKRECLLFDPGEEADKIVKIVQDAKLTPIAILLTHAHFDHIGAVDEIRERYNIPVYLHKAEAAWMNDPSLNGSARYPGLPRIVNRPADHLLSEEGELRVGSFTMEIRHVPGHSPGSVLYSFPEERFAIVGDTLFQRSVGRTDLPGGDTKTLLNSIHTKILTLDPDCFLFPGHGSYTSPGEEEDANPFLHGFE
ncbi:MBL fold metallo-hydrolase [Sporosarcina cyprini]|uniref:MBL fold metallo-hydrolase n=1 Tax=Sporosarcina cyprini TaxID=2910523 RepID=UPI001EE12B33|nr:MBL fold metallo-hydrolase [Sporosarcina cyprini]MCG3089064.1 MBL fold metallo-hydrolase [Sporosarcina cyprini]